MPNKGRIEPKWANDPPGSYRQLQNIHGKATWVLVCPVGVAAAPIVTPTGRKLALMRQNQAERRRKDRTS
jgi:hypothetical protein